MGGVTARRQCSVRSGRIGILPLVIVFAAFFVCCSDALLDEMARLAQEANRPAASPADSSTITSHEAVTLTFSKSMDPGAVTVSGNIGSPAVVWRTTSLSNDTMVLNEGEEVVWTPGAGRTLVLEVAAEGETALYQYDYDVFRGTCISSPANAQKPGEPGTNGTCLHPLDTIQAGIDKAKTMYADPGKGPADVRVAFGTYSVGCSQSPATYVANLVEGVSLHGGYDLAFASRNPTINVSNLVDTDTAGSGSGETTPVRAINADGSLTAITSATVFDGFRITPGKQTGYHCGIYLYQASPTISNVVIAGPGANSGASVVGMMLNGSSAIVQYCTVDPGAADSSSGYTCGLYCLNSSTPQIDHNTISAGGVGANNTYGIRTENGCNALITFDTITGGNFDSVGDGSGYIIRIAGTTNPTITDNHLLLSDTAYQTTYGIFEVGTSSDPAQVRRNNFDYIPGNWYRDETSTLVDQTNWSTQAVSTGEGTDLLGGPAWANTHK